MLVAIIVRAILLMQHAPLPVGMCAIKKKIAHLIMGLLYHRDKITIIITDTFIRQSKIYSLDLMQNFGTIKNQANLNTMDACAFL